MEHRYTRECERPDYDDKISQWLEQQPEDPRGSMGYPVALYYNGFIYRAITDPARGLRQYLRVPEEAWSGQPPS